MSTNTRYSEALTADTPLGAAARRRIAMVGRWHAPAVFPAEVLSAVRGLLLGGEIDTARADAARDRLRRSRVSLHPFAPYAERIWQLRSNLTVYDACYVAVAERPGTVLVTADARAASAPGLRGELDVHRLRMTRTGAGDDVINEEHSVAAGPPQMPGVARPWEQAVQGARAERLVVMRTGIVLDRHTPAFDRLVSLTKLGLGGRISTGAQWISWIHVADFLRAVRFIRDHDEITGITHVTAPNPIRNRDMMATLRKAVGRPWSLPTPKPLVHLGALLLRTDPALALTGRRCIPQRLLDAGFEFVHPTFDSAIQDLVSARAS